MSLGAPPGTGRSAGSHLGWLAVSAVVAVTGSCAVFGDFSLQAGTGGGTSTVASSETTGTGTSTTTTGTTSTDSSSTSSSSTSSSSTSGSSVGCPASDVPAHATLATFDGDGGLSDHAGVGTYGGTAAPTESTTTGALVITENAAAMAAVKYAGTVLFFSGNAADTDCLDVHSYTGVQYDISGSIAGCTLHFSLNDSEHTVAANDAKGSAVAGSYSAQLDVTAQVRATKTTVQVPFTGTGAPTGGSPATALDPSKLASIQWQFAIPAGTASCVSSLTIDNVTFY